MSQRKVTPAPNLATATAPAHSSMNGVQAAGRSTPKGIPGATAISTWLSATTFGILSLSSPQFQHWVLIPIAACGALLGIDLIRYLRGELKFFEPRTFVAVFGLIAFVAVPILHVGLNEWTVRHQSSTPVDMLTGLGVFQSLVVVGLIAMRLVARHVELIPQRRRAHAWIYRANGRNLLFSGLLVTAVCTQLIVGSAIGWQQGLISEVTNRTGRLTGYGPLLVLAESTPLLMTLIICFRYRERLRRSRALPLIILAVILAASVLLVFGGLRGSRSTTLLMVFACIGVFSAYVRPLSRGAIALCALAAFAFMVGYGQYKSLGDRVLETAQSVTLPELFEESGRGPLNVFMGDFGRSDVQAVITAKAVKGEVELALGRTYIGNAAFLVAPRFLVPNRPVGKVPWGTNALLGSNSYQEGRRASRIYGLPGEGLLNFGLLGPPIALTVFGVWLGFSQRFSNGLDENDTRLALVPLMAILSAVALISDSDNLLWASLKYLIIPLAALRMLSLRLPRPQHDTAAS